MKICIAYFSVDENGIHETEVYEEVSKYLTIYDHFSEETNHSFVSKGETFEIDSSSIERIMLEEDDSTLASALESKRRDKDDEHSWFWLEDTSPMLFLDA